MGVNIVSIVPYKYQPDKVLEFYKNEISFKDFFDDLVSELDLKGSFEEKNVWRSVVDDRVVSLEDFDLPTIDYYLSLKEGIILFFNLEVILIVFPVRANFIDSQSFQESICEVSVSIASIFKSKNVFITFDSNKIVYDDFFNSKLNSDNLEIFYQNQKVEKLTDIKIENEDYIDFSGIFKIKLS